ncbi:hypothetical protein J6U76_01950 [bacterium]|nr:hypothetical protein [bacterium]
MRKVVLALAILCLAGALSSKAQDIVGMAPRETSVVIRTQKNIKSFLRIPSPGFCYDEMKYTARVVSEPRATIFQVSMLAPTNQPDRIVMPYARILRPDYTEVAADTFSNAVFWANGQILAQRFSIPEKLSKYLIAVGYVSYRDARHRHIVGGPYETVINEKGLIVHRGEPLMKSKYSAKFSIDSSIMFLDDELEMEVTQEVASKGSTNEVQTVFSYTLVNLDTGKIVINAEEVQKPVIKMKTLGNYALDLRMSRNGSTFWHGMKVYCVLPRLERTFDPDYLGKLTLNDGVICGSSNDVHQLADGRYSAYVKDRITQRYYASEITNIFGGRGRIITQDRGYFSYNLGVRLKLNMPYLLEIDYPEDAPRTIAVSVSGGTYCPCVQTGHTLPYQRPDQFVEQLQLPLNGDVNKMQFIVWAGDDELRNGFNVAIADPGEQNAPFSKKPLILRVSLYSFLTIAVPQAKEKFPEQYQRYVWTEGEAMTGRDGVFFAPVLNSLFFGMNSFSPLALAWNSRGGSNGTVMFPTEHYTIPFKTEINGVEYESDRKEDNSKRSNSIGECADMARYLKMKIFPRLEYGGSDRLKGKSAVGIDGGKIAPFLYNKESSPLEDSVDVTYEGVAEDFIAILKEMAGSVPQRSRGCFENLIIRQRANFTPTSYSDNALKLYAAEKGISLSGDALRTEVTMMRNEDYRIWYQNKKFAFWSKVNEAYNQLFGRKGDLIYYNWRNGGMPYENLYYHDSVSWTEIKRKRCLPVEGFPLPTITSEDLTKAAETWTNDEDAFLKDVLNYPIIPVCPVFGTLAATSQEYYSLFRRGDDLAKRAVKITPNVQSHTLVLDTKKVPSLAGQTMYRSREYSMYDPLLAFIFNNPKYLCFEQTHQACFPFAGITRRFFMNYLALPLVPFLEVKQKEGVPLNVYIGVYENSPYIAVVNKTLKPVLARVSLPLAGVKQLRPLVTKGKRQDYFVLDDTIEVDLNMAPMELRSFKAE